MAIVLALETTSEVCAVALGVADDYITNAVHAPRQHNQRLLPMIDVACRSLGIDRSEIACVAFSAGPGSFTGVRLGAAVAQAIAVGVDAQIYCAPTSLCMGERVFRTTGTTGEFVVQRTSRRELVYEAHLVHDGEDCRFITSDQLVERSVYRGEWALYHESSMPLCASDVLALASRNKANWLAPLEALPIYVEGDHPWKPTT